MQIDAAPSIATPEGDALNLSAPSLTHEYSWVFYECIISSHGCDPRMRLIGFRYWCFPTARKIILFINQLRIIGSISRVFRLATPFFTDNFFLLSCPAAAVFVRAVIQSARHRCPVNEVRRHPWPSLPVEPQLSQYW